MSLKKATKIVFGDINLALEKLNLLLNKQFK